MFLYHFPLLTGWELQRTAVPQDGNCRELQYRIRGCFHPVHVHSPVFLEPTLSSLHSIHDKAVPATGVCLPARATGVVTRFLLHGDAASVMRPRSVMRGDDSAPAQAEMCARGAGRSRARECARVVRAAHVGPHAGMHKEFCRGEEIC